MMLCDEVRLSEARDAKPVYKTVFELMTVSQSESFQAAFRSKKDERKYFTDQLDGIGVARVWTVAVVDGREVGRTDMGTRVVGLYIEDGGWQIADEQANYLGMDRNKWDISRTIEALEGMEEEQQE